jgi:hypothetical protein
MPDPIMPDPIMPDPIMPDPIMPDPIMWPVSPPLICDMEHGADEAILEMAVAPISKLSKAVVKNSFFMLFSSILDWLVVYVSLWQRLPAQYR